MLITELMDEFRNQVSDVEEPYLWSDSEVLGYIIDAQDEFVRLTGGIADMSTPEICEVKVKTGFPFSAHSPYILRIMSGRLLTAERDIKFALENDLKFLIRKDYGTQTAYTLDDTQTGSVEFGILGLEEKKIRWLYVPETDDTCKMRVFRLPFPRIVNEESELEIDEFHHRPLLMWMKHLAYSKQDAETRHDKKALENKLMFEQYCVKAANELERRRYRPRAVQYGGL